MRLGATTQPLQFGRGHRSHFYQLCGRSSLYLAELGGESVVVWFRPGSILVCDEVLRRYMPAELSRQRPLR